MKWLYISKNKRSKYENTQSPSTLANIWLLLSEMSQYIIIVITATIPVECTSDADCPKHKTCVDFECVDPCVGWCDWNNTVCYVRYHKPYCACLPNYFGDPYLGCVTGKTKPNWKVTYNDLILYIYICKWKMLVCVWRIMTSLMGI